DDAETEVQDALPALVEPAELVQRVRGAVAVDLDLLRAVRVRHLPGQLDRLPVDRDRVVRVPPRLALGVQVYDRTPQVVLDDPGLPAVVLHPVAPVEHLDSARHLSHVASPSPSLPADLDQVLARRDVALPDHLG